jgi:glycosyltransferase involved in cell wall biosynthesis
LNCSRLNIAHLSSTFPPYTGGTGNVAYQLCIGLVKSGHRVSVFTAARKDAPAGESLNGVLVHRLNPLISSGNSAFLPQLAWHLRDFDLIHLHYPFLGGESSFLAALFTRSPLVVSYHMDLVVLGWKAMAERLHRATLGRLTLRTARKVLYSSEDYAHHSTSWRLVAGRSGCAGVLPNGVDVQVFSPAPVPELTQLYRSDCSEKIVLMVSALDRAHYFKGVDILLEALAGMPAHVKGILVGEGELRSHYQEKAVNLGLADRIFFPGRVSAEALPGYYRLADLTVLPSTTMGEAFGLVLLESLACGTPVIASNLPGVRSVVSDGMDGYLVRPGDPEDLRAKIAALLHLPEEQQRQMGASGRRKVLDNYDWDKVVERLEEMYDEVLRASQ